MKDGKKRDGRICVFIFGGQGEKCQLIGRRRKSFEPFFHGGSDCTGARYNQALHQNHQKSDIAPFLLDGLIVAIADIFGYSFIEELLIAMSFFP